MIFPKNKALIKSKIEDYKKTSDYFSIFKMKDTILENYKECDYDIYEELIKATFSIGNFDEVILIGNDFIYKGIESFSLIYYFLLSCIANNDIYQAKSIIRKSKVLNVNEIKNLYKEDGANYTKLLNYTYSFPSIVLSLVIVNFVEGLMREVGSGINIDNEYLLFRFFDLLNMLYEIGYPHEIVLKLSNAMKIIFNIDI